MPLAQSDQDGVLDYGTTHHQPIEKDVVSNGSLDGRDSTASSTDAQAGVKTIEAVSSTWTAWSLALAYFGIILIAFTVSLQGQVTIYLRTYATSAFSQNGLLSTVYVISAVFFAVTKPLMAKVADVLGRFEAFAIAVVLAVVGYVQQAAANNVKTYASAQVFYAAGFTGLQILQQVFILDTTDLLNRAIFSSIPDLPYIATIWMGPPIAGELGVKYWRWGYGIWAIILPVAFIPLALSLIISQRKASKFGLLSESPFKKQSPSTVLKNLWFELDFFGLLLLCATVCLILIPLTIAPTAVGTWNNPSIIAMLVVGAGCLVAFPFWERSTTLAPRAFFPRHVLRERNVLLGTAIAFFYFMAFYLSVQPYFQNWLQVVQGESVRTAGYIISIFNIAGSAASFATGFAIKYTRHYKYFVTFGSCVYIMGIGLMIKYRSIGTNVASLIGVQIAIGIGGGMLNVPAQLGVQASVSHQNAAAATAVFLTILEIGGAVGAAIAGAVWSSNLLPKLKMYLPPETKGRAEEIYGNITLAYGGWPPGTPTRDAINRAYQETMGILLLIAVCDCIPMIPMSLMLRNYKLDKIDQNVKGRVIGGREGELQRPDGERHQEHKSEGNNNRRRGIPYRDHRSRFH